MTLPHANLEETNIESGDISDAAGASPELFYLDPSWLLVDPGTLGDVIATSPNAGP